MRLAWATSDDLPATTIRASANYLRTRFIAAALGFLETGRRRSEPLCLECRPLCRFLGRRNDVTLHALMRPAFEKRQGTKSRSVVHRRCGGRYRELTDAHELEAE